MLSNRVLNIVARQKVNVKSLARHFASDVNVKAPEVTPLYDFHVEKGGKMVNFGGFLLPVQYSDLSITASHLHTRKEASLFDVSHMLQSEITGSDCIEYLETMVTADLQQLPNNSCVLTVFTDKNGGILDDLIITKVTADYLYVVSNAGRKDHDMSHLLTGLEDFRKNKPKSNTKIRFFTSAERALIALQGPQAGAALAAHTAHCDLAQLYFMQSTVGTVAGVQGCRVTRCGYTGEDGFEISIPAIKAVDVSRALLTTQQVKLAGLGARDSLRLEAGLCLYGQDITTATTPPEAALNWLIPKSRRTRADFPGAARINEQIKGGVERKRVGLLTTAANAPPARTGAQLVDAKGAAIGEVTSGCPAPSLGVNVAMGYVVTSQSKVGTLVGVNIRGKVYEAKVAKMPFVPSHYRTNK